MKRKAESSLTGKTPPAKKRSKNTLSEEDTKARFRKGLFDKAVLEGYATEYGASTPYKHCVISELVDDKLLRAVRDEIRANVSFTPKETDIYKIHQSGDLANLDGLDDEALAKLPSLLALRDALYSQTFRDYVSHITACGPLSGRKTDMAINVYTPGCYLLCHDDVIGSRKVSYILYLTDPDLPWKPEWGGALRLYPVSERTGEDGVVAKTPGPDPGESFHDVEEVYHAATKEELRRQGGRIRMAISGWFHIPQPGEDGYVPGAEEKAAKNSSLMQLQGNPDQYDRPLPRPVPVADQGEGAAASDDVGTLEDLNAEDLDFLLRYIAPTYLTPDTLEQVAEHFDADSSITLPGILCASFAERLRAYVEAQEAAGLPDDSEAIEAQGPWKPGGDGEQEKATTSTDSIRNGKGKAPAAAGAANEADSPIRELLEVLLPSRPFRAWLQVATKSVIESHDLVVRRFRRGNDYTLATGHDGKPRLELNLGFTPTTGWGDDDDEEDADEDEEQQQEDGDSDGSEAQPSPKGKGKEKATNGSKAKPNGGRRRRRRRLRRARGLHGR
ncbi:hypothetical protein VTK73DRAFT_2908 [Phialemonium thermophilum]|uniref:Fe2OG dioxygenase domain-containing protein n=1 Tax=Phialemonium thermophilum TaxID=223376 RepID=A0ABR3VML7_9PEZI